METGLERKNSLCYINNQIYQTLGEQICRSYGTKRLASMDEARLEIFLRKYETKNLNKSLTKI